ncbi:MAG: hypothetical protein WDZ74_00090 [Candidatus Paceibacterota bacterium]
MKYFLRKLRIGERRGFTVIEAFVGISILLIGLVGPLMLVNSNLQAGRFSRDQITSYYLAQEAIEMVREVRDENFLNGGVDWLSGISSQCYQAASTIRGCRVDGRPGVVASATIMPCSNCPNSAVLRVDTNTGRYGYAGSTLSRFYRYIQLEDIDGGSGVIVRVRVGFDTGRYIQKYTTTDYLRDWDPR